MLDKEIVEKLSKVLKGRKTSGTIKKDISLLRHEYPACTANARAQIYAIQNETSVWQLLSKEDKASLPSPMPTVAHQQSTSTSRKTKREAKKERIIHFVRYDTSDAFRLAHLNEANRAYTYKCFTSAFIICRKFIENMVADILRAKFPPRKRENKELYYDTARGRIRDFKELLVNLESKKQAFEMDKRLVEQFLTKVQPFKEEADQQVHSWYHIIRTKAELDKMGVQNIFDLLHSLEDKVRLLG